MRIDIVPEGNKTKKEGSGSDFGFPFIFDAVFGGVGKLAESVVSSISSGIEETVSSVLRRIFSVLLGVFGIFFLFSGFAKMLDYIYGTPGVGEVVVGVLVFASSISVSAFASRGN